MPRPKAQEEIVLKPWFGAGVLNLTIPDFLARLLKIKVGDVLYVKRIEGNKLLITNVKDEDGLRVTVRHCTGKIKGKAYLGITIPKKIAEFYEGKELKLEDFYAVEGKFSFILQPI